MVSRIFLSDTPPASPGSEDDEFADASGGVPGGWTEVDHGATTTVTEDEIGLRLLQATHASGGVAGIYKAIPAGDFTYWTRVSYSGLQPIFGGIALWEDATSAAGDVRSFILQQATGNVNLTVGNWTQWDTFSAIVHQRLLGVDALPTGLHLRVRRNGTTYYWDFSSDGIGWLQLESSPALGITPAHIGPAMHSDNTGIDGSARFAFWRYLPSDVGRLAPGLGDRGSLTASGGLLTLGVG